ncbi:MAG: hypothetical protein IJC81_00770 [Clostridia bacterium]|nr:hypothetical protein [Clostridia bacterium]
MNFFDDGCANGGFCYSRSELLYRIEKLYEKIDEENEKKEELLNSLCRVERAIERWKEVLSDMEALLN